MTGSTRSSAFPTTVGAYDTTLNGLDDVFVTKLTWNGSALSYGYSTFIGGSDASDSGSRITLDSGGNAYVVGNTSSSNFPLVNQISVPTGSTADAFVLKLNAAGSGLSFSSRLGGTDYDYGTGIARDSAGTIYLSGYTLSTNFPTTNALPMSTGAWDAFVVKIRSDGLALIYSTYLGSADYDRGYGIAADTMGAVYVTGETSATSFPTASPLQPANGGGPTDVFAAKISTTTSITGTRTITYTYDGLLRLSSATENPGKAYTYTYDLAGNRTDAWVNGIPAQPHRTYNAANQISGWSYDAVGNLLGDGVSSYTYDALNRTLSVSGLGQTRTNIYNGDGTLVSQTASSVTTRYTQDLAAPLSQVLQTQIGAATRTDYLYGLSRLASLNGSTKTWYAADALGSVRRTVTDAGVPQGIVNYDPWGTPESGTVPTFGFTGEVQDVGAGLVNLRARWYSTARGRFTSVDPFAGVAETPYSLHQYAYGLSDPVLMTDPQGTSPWDIKALEGIYIGAVIQNHFVSGDRSNRVAELEIPGASKKYPNRVAGYADMVDFSNGEMYEIKPKDGTIGPEEQLQRYLWHIAKAGVYGQVDPPTTGKWHRGDTYLTTEQSFGLWPYGIDPQFIPGPNSTYWVIKAQRTQPGVVEYWGEQVSDDRAQKEAWNYDPNEIIGFIERTYQGWRKEKFPTRWPRNGSYRPRPYPNLVPVPPIISQIKEACWQMLIDLSHLGEQLQNPFALPLPSPGSWPAKGRY